MNIIDQARKIPHGMEVISEWLGDGGEVVAPADAQSRAEICVNCPSNRQGAFTMTATVASAIRRHLEVKNSLQMRVDGENRLGICEGCGCALKLKIWLPQDRVRAEMAGDDRAKYPAYCWQLK